MRTLFRTAICFSLAAVVWSHAASSNAVAGVRGKPTKLKTPVPASVAGRVAQNTNDYSAVPSRPVPIPADSLNTETVVNEQVVGESLVEGSSRDCATPTVVAPRASTNTNTIIVAIPMMMPMAAPTMMMATPMMNAPACSSCGGMGGGMSPAAAAAYGQSFPNGYYRSGAEAGMYHFPYYSYRRPWYYTGQPSFHRSTDLVW